MTRQLALTLILFGTVAATAAVAAPEALTVTVYDFTDVAGSSGGYGSKVTPLVTASLTAETNLIMVERADLKAALSEQAVGLAGIVSSDTAAKIGRITGAKVLVTGQVIVLEQKHLVLIAHIIGTETARLFAVKAEGAADNLLELASDLGASVAQVILKQRTSLLAEARELSADRLDRIVKSIPGTKRPVVSVSFWHPKGPQSPSFTANTEMGIVLQKAGFEVVDGKSERKPDVVITGVMDVDGRPPQGGIHTEHGFIEVKAQERQTGAILALDCQESVATGATQMGTQRSAQALAVDELAERLLPLLAK